MNDLNKFYKSLIQDVVTMQSVNEEGDSQEQTFTRITVDMLIDTGETENVFLAYDEKSLGTKNQHKINAYSVSENYETLDLFITIYNGTDEITKLQNNDIENSTKRILNFIKKCFGKNYYSDIEESSPIFQFAYMLANNIELKNNLVRINAFILTDGLFQGKYTEKSKYDDYTLFYKVFDIEYFYNISDKESIPVLINFLEDGFYIPCIPSPNISDEYQSYLAIFSGRILADMYEKFGSRLLQQNVRSFLQFTGKINRGIRNTIKEEPHMFLAFNNGIAATANSIELENNNEGNGLIISKIHDFQIVNGGQTTASIYHTWKKDKAVIDNIFVQVKLTVVKNRNKFSEIVSRISEYANTQNKVSFADLSSNKPFHIQLEQLSRTTFTPITDIKKIQTIWFYERARGQYKNARLKDGITKSRQKLFDSKYPKSQVFTKEELSKYVNSYKELLKGNKILIGPHIVVRGNQKNYVEFMKNLPSNDPDNVFFEDTISKAILFKSAETIYGVKPNSIGDMRYITVPYSISWLTKNLDYRLDLFKIWKNQSISQNLTTVLREIMIQIEPFIKRNAPGSLYGEWAKKEECWLNVREENFNIDLKSLESDLLIGDQYVRKIKSRGETLKEIEQQKIQYLSSIPKEVWTKIINWGSHSQEISEIMINFIYNIKDKLIKKIELSNIELKKGIELFEIIIEKNPDLLFFENDDIDGEQEQKNIDIHIITFDLLRDIISWNRKKRRLFDYEIRFMADLVNGNKELNDHNKKIALKNYQKALKNGYDSQNKI